MEVEAGGRAYALLPVDVPEFGFIDVYGTDVTAVKERERLARENERLLLNILPEPIAQRLRVGEPLIAGSASGCTADRSWLASSAPGSSSTTSGGTP